MEHRRRFWFEVERSELAYPTEMPYLCGMKLTRVLAYVAFVACATLILSSTSFAQAQTGWYPYARSATIGDTVLVGDYYFCPIIYGFCPCMDNSTLSDTEHFFWRDSVGHDFQNGDGLAAYKLYYHPT